ncbi:MAG: rhomboid family intramembrane serine protease [Fimbriimonadaceae bacterium]|nr:rhomboid family intramembrane serine protease [Chitinophagales bacterium]
MTLTVTLIIIILTVITSMMAFNNPIFKGGALFIPYGIARRKEYHRFITSGFIHADWMHLIFNMYVLYIFGETLEKHYLPAYFDMKARIVFIIIYIVGMVVSDIPTYFKYRHSPGYASLGASGAVSAIVFATILLNPMAKMGLLFIPVMLPGFIFGGLYLIYSVYMSRKGGDNINHDAHFYGALVGLTLPGLFDPIIFKNFFNQIMNIL